MIFNMVGGGTSGDVQHGGITSLFEDAYIDIRPAENKENLIVLNVDAQSSLTPGYCYGFALIGSISKALIATDANSIVWENRTISRSPFSYAQYRFYVMRPDSELYSEAHVFPSGDYHFAAW